MDAGAHDGLDIGVDIAGVRQFAGDEGDARREVHAHGRERAVAVGREEVLAAHVTRPPDPIPLVVNGRPIPPSVLEEMARFSKERWPELQALYRKRIAETMSHLSETSAFEAFARRDLGEAVADRAAADVVGEAQQPARDRRFGEDIGEAALGEMPWADRCRAHASP